MNTQNNLHPHIVIIGGGAGGLELATRLGKRLGKKQRARITLIDRYAIHIWKPLLHEVAAGTLLSYQEQISYINHAYAHHFHFQLGQLKDLDRTAKTVTLAPTLDETGQQIIPERKINYDILVIAIGSISNNFGIPGVAQYCHQLEDQYQANAFQQQFLGLMTKAQTQPDNPGNKPITIAIIGGGATGVELAAELQKSILQAVSYGFDQLNPEQDIAITLIESSERVLAALPERLSTAVTHELNKLGITVYTGKRVTVVTEDTVTTHDGLVIPAKLKVWAAGIKAPDVLRQMDGLKFNEKNQLLVTDTLQTTADADIFAFGDCAAMPHPIPPRAQAAHQQASHLTKAIVNKLRNKPLSPYVYKDRGSLVTLGYKNTLGSLMGNLIGPSMMIEGTIAHLVYIALYKSHQATVHGFTKMVLLTLANLLTRRIRPRLKLH